jgi:chemotaxis protein CheZ
MSSAAFSGEIGRRVAALAKSGPGLDPADIKEVVESVLASMDLDLTTGNLKVYSEIQGLAQFIRDLKTEIATLRPDDVTEEHLPAANDELEAVVGATEKATNEIFEAVEAIEALAEKMDGKVAEQVNEAVTKVYEACSFQDITGQRIGKVVGALQQVEVKMQALLEAFGAEIEKLPRGAPAEPKPLTDEDLMNGPQMPDAAMNQDDIDAILAGMD